MHLTAGMVYDGILVVLVLYILFRGWHQGAASELIRLAGWGAAIVLVSLFAGPWAERIYHGFLEQIAVRSVAKAIPPDVITALESGALAVQSLQEILNSLNGFFGAQTVDPSTVNNIITMFNQDAGSLAEIITQNVLQPVLISVCRVLLSIGILEICLFISRILARLMAAHRRDTESLLSMTNRFLGLALGFGESLVSGYVYVFILSLVTTFFTTKWLSPEVLQGTVFVRLFL